MEEKTLHPQRVDAKCCPPGNIYIYIFPLLGVPGMTIAYIAADLMHCGDLGVVLYLLGNVLYDLFVEMGGTQRNPNQSISNIVNFIKMASKKLHIEPPVNNLSINMIRAKGKRPKLKTKAAVARGMLRVVNHILPATGLVFDL